MNKILLSGTICGHISYEKEENKVFCLFQIRCKRINGKEDVIPCKALHKVVPNIFPGCQISLLGKVQTKNIEKNKNTVSIFVNVRETMPYLGMDLNEVFLENAYIFQRPVLRTSPQGRKICDVCLAVNEEFGLVNYIPCTCWDEYAIMTANSSIGDSFSLTGKFRSRSLVRTSPCEKKGKERTTYEISVLNIERLVKRN